MRQFESIFESSKFLHDKVSSNVALFNPATGKGERVAIREVDGRKVRVFRSGAVVGA